MRLNDVNTNFSVYRSNPEAIVTHPVITEFAYSALEFPRLPVHITDPETVQWLHFQDFAFNKREIQDEENPT